MRVLLRTLLVCLLALALPLQGWAAATLAPCGSGHHDAVGHAAQAGHVHAAGEHPTHPAASADADHGHSCSACAACCSVGALPGPLPALARAEPAPAVFALIVPGVAPYAADGPERPPRNTGA
jgi:hypothetical protein